MTMRTFFTGTTYECAMQILRDGKITTRPPHRVWKEHSEDYVYFIDPKMVSDELEYDTEDAIDRSIALAADQASFAVWEFDHTRRVVFEVELDDELCDDDPDCGCAVRYPFDIEFSMIRSIHIEKRNNSRKLKESVALSKLFREEGCKKTYDLDDRQELSQKYKGLEYMESKYWSDLELRYDDLVDWQGDLSLFSHRPFQQFLSTLKVA